jgi:uncharacterized protein (TIGR02145 family)
VGNDLVNCNYGDGYYFPDQDGANFWTSTEHGYNRDAYVVKLPCYSSIYTYVRESDKEFGYSVRCLRDLN